MEFLLYFLLPFTIIIYGVGMVLWITIYTVKYTSYLSLSEKQLSAQRLLQTPIWPAVVFGMLLKFFKELKAVAKGEEEK